MDVFKKPEKYKVLSNMEKAGTLSKAEELGVTVSLLETLGLLSKAEDLGLPSLAESATIVSPTVLPSWSCCLFSIADSGAGLSGSFSSLTFCSTTYVSSNQNSTSYPTESCIVTHVSVQNLCELLTYPY